MAHRRLLFIIGIGITAVSLFLALRGTDFAGIGRSLGKASLEMVPAFLLCLVVFYALKAFRWRRLLTIDGAAPETKTLVGPMMIGFAANNLLPFRLGEVIRMEFGAKCTSIPRATVLTSLVVERVFDVMALLILASIVGWAGWDENFDHPAMQYVSTATVMVAGALLLLAFGSRKMFQFLRYVEPREPPRVVGWLFKQVNTVDAGMQSIRSPAQLSAIIVNSIVQWLFLAAAILIACHAVDTTISMSIAIYLMLVMTIAISVPSTPGFIGIIEYSFVLTLGAFAIDADKAMAAAIFYHVLTWLAITAVGTSFLHRYSLGWKNLGTSPADLKVPGRDNP